jgi:hypothetical protein
MSNNVTAKANGKHAHPGPGAGTKVIRLRPGAAADAKHLCPNAKAFSAPDIETVGEVYIAIGTLGGKRIRMVVRRDLPIDEFFAYVSDKAKAACASDGDAPQVAEVTLNIYRCRDSGRSHRSM